MKVKFYLFINLILILMFSACKSLPLPGSPTESLFVMTGSMDNRLGSKNGRIRSANQVTITIENAETGKTKTISFTPRKNYVAVPLEPGRYLIQSKVKVEMSENPGGQWTVEKYIGISPFQIEPTTVFISPAIFKLSSNNRGFFSVTSFSSLSNSNKIRRQAVEEVFENRRFKAWENYQIIGWDTEDK